MADETETETKSFIAIGMKSVDPVVLPRDPEPQYGTAAERLRTFEDAEFGPDAVRVAGHIERGSGSKFSFMTPAKKREYVALERLVDAEAALSVAAGALSAAQADFDAAAAAVDAAAEQSKPKQEA